MRNLRRLAGTRRPNVDGSTPDGESLATLAELGAVEVGLGRLWWRLSAMTNRSRRPHGVRAGDIQQLGDDVALLADYVALAVCDDQRARQLSRQLGELRRHLVAVAHDAAGEHDPEWRIPAGALEPVREHLESLREQVARAARHGEGTER